MNISAKDIGKKYGRNWIFRHLNFEIKEGTKTAITGKNGSGKSTLLQVISGYLTPSHGSIQFQSELAQEPNITFLGPYSELIEEFTLAEFLKFHAQFRKPQVPFVEMADRASLPLKKFIGDFSTGMKQRAKLITAFFYENDFILLDEPTANLDEEGFTWWKEELLKKTEEAIVIASNQQNEIVICQKTINL